MTTFIATFSHAQDDGEILMAGMADHQFDTKEYVLLQKSPAAAAEDAFRGEDEVEITFGDQLYSAQGGIESIELLKGALRIKVTAPAAAQLATDDEILIKFDPELAGLDQLATILERMLGERFVDNRG